MVSVRHGFLEKNPEVIIQSQRVSRFLTAHQHN